MTSGLKKAQSGPRTLAIDIGGTGIKSVLLDAAGKPISEFGRVLTPRPATPKAVLGVIADIAKPLEFDRVAVGFPGVVRNGVVRTAPHLHQSFIGVDVQREITKRIGKPALVANDAMVQGLAAISGEGVEMAITLGTGMGSAIFVGGRPIPLEVGHHPFRHGRTYEDEICNAALEDIGKKRWNKRLHRVLKQLELTFNYDRLFIGGGNAKKINFRLPKNTQTVDNADGLYGAIALWKSSERS
jgi:polyphosphate glucokinase